MRPILAALACSLLGAAPPAPAPPVAAPPVDAATRRQVVTALAAALERVYVFPEHATDAAHAILSAEKSGAFDADTNSEEFADAITKTLAGVLHDKHLRVIYSPEPVPSEDTNNDNPTDRTSYDQDRAEAASQNFGVLKATRLRGNVGYIDVRLFPPANIMGDALAAAMQFLANTDALIVDLRKNGGGDPASVSMFVSYLTPPWQSIHVNDIYSRTPGTNGGETRQFWTTYVPGPRYVEKPVYVLTGSYTFSAGEEFAYDMQTEKRATVIGAVTGGGANPGRGVRLSEHFAAFVPDGRAVNPVTKTNWEGVGITPDIATAESAALQTAYLAALKAKLAKATDPAHRKAYSDLIALVTSSPETILTQ